MSKNVLLTIAGVSAAIFAALGAAPDPVLMTVGGKDVPQSEFEYLFNKNNAQQQQPQSVDEYMKMFTDYKLKVAAAEAAGLDTTASFREEMERYAGELADPYMRVKAVDDSIALVTYSHMLKNRDISHIMLNSDNRALADSLHALLASGSDFAELADAYSVDPSAKMNHGHIGFISAGMYPYAFEEKAYDTSIGELSPVFSTRFGLHIIKVNGERDDRGEVKVRHILKLTQNLAPEDTLRKLQQIDSIYTALKNGADFSETAMRETEDPSGTKNGGDLPWFGAGRMVPEFEAAAFSLSDGEISAPVRTSYGYHLILKEGSRRTGTFEDSRKAIDELMARDERSVMASRRATQQYRERYGIEAKQDVMNKADALIAESGGDVRAALTRLRECGDVIASGCSHELTVGDAASLIQFNVPADKLAEVFRSAVEYKLNELARSCARADLVREEPSYANLLNEYHDGLLLYEISNNEVWDKPNRDPQGLERYYEAHRNEYTWDKPRYKGYLIMAENDSVAEAARAYLNEGNVPDDSLTVELRKRFGTDAKVERVLAATGANAVIDYVAFGGPHPKAVGRWNAFLPFRYRIIAQPEEAADVKGQLSVDYQKELEKEWLDKLRRTYRVKVNEKTLKALRDKYSR
ncbi:MAG: peptidyl-prolyl cis-trans isomerase [Muribaculaceae bacterium]|nr:peptidyl-prolyl cis-trans isomerase [Muribaculaceae bacterium]